ncbi:MAG: 30S ribosomal protein S1 [Desulfobacterales bacterium]|nr:30S ribosomal protein S1 [Desulfobacterales bacterium]
MPDKLIPDNSIHEAQNGEEQSFADLFESYSSGMKDDLQVGDKIHAKIISIGKDAVFVDTGSKVDGIVERAELLDDQGNLPFLEGESIELYVISAGEHEMRLSRAISGIGGLELLRDAFANAIPVQGKITQTCKGGVQVDLAGSRAFCPVSQIDVAYVQTPEDYVGQTCEFLITQFEQNGKNIVVSRRKLLSLAMEKEKEAFMAKLKPGDILNGRVTSVKPYGVFVELIPGVEGMVHISELSWSRVENPATVVRTRDAVSVKVMAIADGDQENQKKIALSMKQVGADPWDSLAEKFHAGDKVSGKITRCLNFGAFVEIAPGIEGLVHISEMSYLKRIARPEDVVSPGDTVSVLIKELHAGERRISLSLRDVQGDPWLEAADKFSVGQTTEGVLEKKEKFGYFVSLAPGITGLLPKSKMSEAENPGWIEKLKTGDRLAVTVVDIRPLERKITLAAGDATEQGWENFARPATAGTMGDLAEKLQQALRLTKK